MVVDRGALVSAWMGRPGRINALVWGADRGLTRPGGDNARAGRGTVTALGDEGAALVLLFADRVKVSWDEQAEVLPADSEVAALHIGLAWVAARAAEHGNSIVARVSWLVSWLVEVDPDGDYRKVAQSSVPTVRGA